MIRAIRLFLLFEAAAFAAASAIHSGALVAGYAHRQARVAESVIAAVLVAGLALTWLRPASARQAGIVAQGFALVGTLVGVLTIAIGVGPRTVPDVVYHVAIVAVLVRGLLVARGAPEGTPRTA